MKILVAEDDPVSRRVLERTLAGWRYEVVAVDNGDEALGLLLDEENGPRLALLDWLMPKMDGPEVCRQLRASGASPFAYLILLSGKDRKEDIIEGLESGADDYLVKPYDKEELRCRIRAGERIVILHEELQRANAELERRATYDYLTNQLNRAAILERFSEELARAKRKRSSLSVVMADIDRFKAINDTYGHLAGDDVLVEFTTRLDHNLREYDVLGRYGGEEFLILMPEIPASAAREPVERLRLSIEEKPFIADGFEIPVTASFGVVSVEGDIEAGVEDLIRQADDLLYEAKETGRNEVVAAAFDPAYLKEADAVRAGEQV